MINRKLRLAIWATVIVAVPFALTASVILGGHFFGRHHETITVNWAWCAATSVGLAGAWLLKERRRGRQTP
jgi:hypothetical protein